MQEGEYRYDAFISYNHADTALAKRLSARIRRYRAPRTLNLNRRHLVPFRDVEQLTPDPDLSQTLKERLRVSRYLVVLCSPGAANSRYVNQEIEYFAGERETDNILAVLCAGEPDASFPPALKSIMDEPLFVDLRPAGNRLQQFRRFRGESLRIIASLLGVDYSEVAREDDRRRRRNRALGAFGVTTMAATIAAAFLVSSVEPQTWQEVPLPDSGKDLPDFAYGNPLMPVKDIAFSKEDPSALVFIVRDAEWHGQKPHQSVSIRGHGTGIDFRSAVDSAIAAHEQSVSAVTSSPFLSLSFEIYDDNDRRTAKGSAELFSSSVEGEQYPGFHQVLWITGTSPDNSGLSRRYVVATKRLSASSSPVLDWPADAMFAEKLIPRDGIIRGRFESSLDNSGGEFQYLIMDAMDEFRDAIGPERFDQRIASNVSGLTVEYEGVEMRLADVNAELEIWQQLLESGEWITYTGPVIRKYPISGRSSDGVDARAADLAAQLNGDSALAGHLARSDIDIMEGRSASILARDEAAGRFRLAVLLGEEEHTIAHGAGISTVKRELFLQGPRDSGWQRLSVPTVDPVARVTDFRVLDGQGMHIFLVFGGEGYYRSQDGGRTWHDFNFGEKRLAGDGEIKTVLVGEEPAVYAFVDNDPEGDGWSENYLFRLERRDWQARLRLGLVELLAPQ